MSSQLLREFIRVTLLESGVRKKFHMELPEDLVFVAKAFKDNGHELYVVGGSVRDAILGKVPKDYDLASDATPDRVIEVVNKLPDHHVVEVGKSFGVVRVVTPDKNEYEVATFRSDIGKGRRPDSVEFTSIENDVLRRDLTINALFYDIDTGEIVDYVGGLDDIKNRIVRAVGNPVERFDEDRLRILRALRFASRMGSNLDKGTHEAIKNDNSLAGVSPERIRDEFLKGIVGSRSVDHFLNLIDEYDLWPQVFPGLRVSSAIIESKRVPVVLAALLIQNDPTIVAKRLNALKYTAEEASQASFLMRLNDLTPENAFRMKKLFIASHLTDDDVREFFDEEGFIRLKKNVMDAFIEYNLSIKGSDLIAQGFSGAELGRELERQETLLFRQLL